MVTASASTRWRPSRRRLAAFLTLAALTSATGVGAVQANADTSVVGTVGAPVKFQLEDANGSWYDTGTSLFGDKSLAVAELPTVGPAGSIGLPSGAPSAPGLPSGAPSAPGLPSGAPSAPGLPGGAPSLPAPNAANITAPAAAGSNVSQVPLHTDLQSLAGAGTKKTVGSLGVDPQKLLGFDKLKSNITTLFGAKDDRAVRAFADMDQLTKELASKPAATPVNINAIPAGADLIKQLGLMKKDVKTVPVTANFNVSQPVTAMAHTTTSLIWPEGAAGFPVDQNAPWRGDQPVQLTAPGLYAFGCKVHPYMLGAVVVNDPLSIGGEFGPKLHVQGYGGLSVPSNADIIDQLVKTFFIITNTGNWQTYSDTQDTTWAPQFPVAPISTYDDKGNLQLIPDLDAYFDQKFSLPKTLPATKSKPSTPGVGEVWVDTQLEQWAGKDKPGSATRINASNWNIERKIGAPQIGMNNPHNMWTDLSYKYLFQTEWWNDKLDVFDRNTGAFIRQITVGPSPSHVMGRPNGELVIDVNGGNEVVEVSPDGSKVDKRIPLSGPNKRIALPHAQWMTSDGKYAVTPNVGTGDASVVDLDSGQVKFEPLPANEEAGAVPLATGTTADDSSWYMADFLTMTVTCGSLKAAACVNPATGAKEHEYHIDLWKASGYDPKHHDNGNANPPMGGLSIQNPIAPDDKGELVANVLGGLSVIDVRTNKVVKTLPCDAGCHGINVGAKKGGGYYYYVSSKFSNALSIVDLDPNNDGDISDAAIVGRMTLGPQAGTQMDGTITGFPGFGGQGVLPLPLVYNGSSQMVPEPWASQLTCQQKNPVDYATVCK